MRYTGISVLRKVVRVNISFFACEVSFGILWLTQWQEKTEKPSINKNLTAPWTSSPTEISPVFIHFYESSWNMNLALITYVCNLLWATFVCLFVCVFVHLNNDTLDRQTVQLVCPYYGLNKFSKIRVTFLESTDYIRDLKSCALHIFYLYSLLKLTG